MRASATEEQDLKKLLRNLGNKTKGKNWAKPQKTKEKDGKEQTVRTARRQRHGGVANQWAHGCKE